MTRIYEPITMPELARMKQLADAGMSAGAIGLALSVDFGTHRGRESVRYYLRQYHGWQGKPRGTPFARNNERWRGKE